MLTPRQFLEYRRRQIEAGINLLVVARQGLAARELESVLLDIDAQLMGLTFQESTHVETRERPAVQ